MITIFPFQKPEPIISFRGENAFLSNFYAAPLVYEGVAYATSEAAYQAAKTLCPDMKEKIRLASSPVETKRLGKKLELRPDWDDIKIKVMTSIVYEKFKQSSYLTRRLLATGTRDLQERNSWGDIFWGMNLEGTEGLNHLGKILMAVRERRYKELYDI